MKQHSLSILLLTTIVFLLTSACNNQSQAKIDAVGNTVIDQAVISIESSNAPQSVINSAEAVSNEDPVALLASGDSELLLSNEMVEAGSSPEVEKAEQIQDPVYPTFSEGIEAVNPDDVPSLEERNAFLNGVNQGGLVIEGGDVAVGEGPAPGTETMLAGGEQQESNQNRGAPIVPPLEDDPKIEPLPGQETEAFQGSQDGGILNQVIETLRSWLIDLLS